MSCGRTFHPFYQFIYSIVLASVAVSGRSVSSTKEVKPVNDRPIIGVMTQTTPTPLLEYGCTYLPATYVKFIESAGARVVPILVNKDYDYYLGLFNSLNGLLLPGGGLDALLDSGYGRAGKIFYDLALESAKVDDYFPIWGTCQGFELLACIAAGSAEKHDTLSSLESLDKNLNVSLEEGAVQSKLLSQASQEVLKALKKKAVTYNYHHFSLTRETYDENVALKSVFKVVSTSTNAEGEEFISMIEGQGDDYPFYGVQFHPEKPIFAWAVNTTIKHDPVSVMVSQYFANFFVSEARFSNHTFDDYREEQDALIFNYPMVNLKGKENLDQAYFFD